jgi:hypothetical protein
MGSVGRLGETVVAQASGYNTNLAAEFYVLSVLHRLGYSASLTLGNRKAVDIVVESRGRVFTIDVKGMASRTIWPMDNFKPPSGTRHFIALVTFHNRIDDVAVVPSVFLVPATQISKYFYRNPKGTRVGVRYSRMRDAGKRFLEAWKQLR